MRDTGYKHIVKTVLKPRATIKRTDLYQHCGSGRTMPVFTGMYCSGCTACETICPTGAISLKKDRMLVIGYDSCVACGACIDACVPGALTAGRDIMGSVTRDALKHTFDIGKASNTLSTSKDKPVRKISSGIQTKPNARINTVSDKMKLFIRSMHVREVDCGSCNACELEIAAISNPLYDAERFGIHIVASPRHADVLFVTGPVTRQMELALRKTDAATPKPKLIVAVGACACSGGLFGNTSVTGSGVDELVNVDLYIPGCPPSPRNIIKTILSLRNGADKARQ